MGRRTTHIDSDPLGRVSRPRPACWRHYPWWAVGGLGGLCDNEDVVMTGGPRLSAIGERRMVPVGEPARPAVRAYIWRARARDDGLSEGWLALDCVLPCVERCDGSELAPDRGARLIKGAGQAPDQGRGVVVVVGVGGADARIATAAGAALCQSAGDKPRHNSGMRRGGYKTVLLCVRNHPRIGPGPDMDSILSGSMCVRHKDGRRYAMGLTDR